MSLSVQGTFDVVLIDGLNLFCRHYAANPTLGGNGQVVGGAVGMLKAISRIVDDVKPATVVIAWEGGGSTRRRHLLPEYKSHRRPVKLNRFYEGDIPDSNENFDWQVRLTVEIASSLPICQVYVEGCEADDVIGRLARYRFRGKRVLIVSSDRDFYQLIDGNTSIFRPSKKVIIGVHDVIDEYGIHPTNFCLARAIAGDGSDNIGGVGGIGLKTIASRFPMFKADGRLCLDDIITECTSKITSTKHPPKLFERLINSRQLIERNLRLMELDGSMLTADQTKRIDGILDAFDGSLNKLAILKVLQREGLLQLDVEQVLCPFMQLILRSK